MEAAVGIYGAGDMAKRYSPQDREQRPEKHERYFHARDTIIKGIS